MSDKFLKRQIGSHLQNSEPLDGDEKMFTDQSFPFLDEENENPSDQLQDIELPMYKSKKKKGQNAHDKNLRNMMEMSEPALVSKLMPLRFKKCFIGWITVIYGFLGLISIITLIFYCIDYYISFFYSEYSSYDWIYLYVICGLNSICGIFGMIYSFKFGIIFEKMMQIKQQNNKTHQIVTDVNNNIYKLREAQSYFQIQVNSITDITHDLNCEIILFEELENDLKSLYISSNNVSILTFLKTVQRLSREFKIISTQVQKANLLQIFYELEFGDDDQRGLNLMEYNEFLKKLDKETRDKFKTFEQLDINNDKNIDVNEFEQELDRIYTKIDTSMLFNKPNDRVSSSKNKLNNNNYNVSTKLEWKNKKQWLTK